MRGLFPRKYISPFYDIFHIMYENILVAVDGSDSNKVAVDDALSMAKQLGSKVTAICVFDIGSYAAVAQGYGMGDEREYMLEASKESLRYISDKAESMGIDIKSKVITGRPADVIVEASKDFDLVVCGTLGRTGISRTIMGSVAEKVARLSYCPVLICRKVQ